MSLCANLKCKILTLQELWKSDIQVCLYSPKSHCLGHNEKPSDVIQVDVKVEESRNDDDTPGEQNGAQKFK